MIKKVMFVAMLTAVMVLIAGCRSDRILIKVLSNSMEPTIKSGELVGVEKINSSEIKVRDILAFESNDERGFIILARVVSIDREKGAFTAKGDGNKDIGPFEKDVPFANIKGRVLGKK